MFIFVQLEQRFVKCAIEHPLGADLITLLGANDIYAGDDVWSPPHIMKIANSFPDILHRCIDNNRLIGLCHDLAPFE